ncbi:phosphopentomutase [bacterium]|nr:phosphopentomutase [bacterium]
MASRGSSARAGSAEPSRASAIRPASSPAGYDAAASTLPPPQHLTPRLPYNRNVHFRRVTVLVLDGVGCGSAPDSAFYGDSGSDTLRHVLEACSAQGQDLRLPTLTRLGLGALYPDQLPGLPPGGPFDAHHGRMTEVSAGKDSTTGHWEICCLPRLIAAPTFPAGFPAALIRQFEAACGHAVLGNKVASGTQIIQELGSEHLATGKLIVYTSADSVFQIAAHVDKVPLQELYRCCELARDLLSGPLAVDRVIARPFAGSAESGFVRTPDRRDFSLEPPAPTLLDILHGEGLDVIGVGKIADLFCYPRSGRGLSQSFPFHTTPEQLLQTGELLRDQSWEGLLFCNLVDFDQLYGHRNDPQGFGRALEAFDRWLESSLPLLGPADLLLITADHGNDPTTSSTDHSREQVPLLIYAQSTVGGKGRLLAPPVGLHHIGATVAAALGVTSSLPGVSLLEDHDFEP